MSRATANSTLRSKSQSVSIRDAKKGQQLQYLNRDDISVFLPKPLHYNVSKESLREQTIAQPKSNIIQQALKQSHSEVKTRTRNSYSSDQLLQDYQGLIRSLHMPQRASSPPKTGRGQRRQTVLKAMWPIE